MLWWKGIFRKRPTEFDSKRLAELENRLGYRFQNISLVEKALRHRSSLQRDNLDASDSNELMEFLGDAVIGLITAEHLYLEIPDVDEGKLTQIKSVVVSGRVLGAKAAGIGLGDFLLMGAGEARNGGRDRPSILEDAFEAMVGAIYLDGGLKAAENFVHRILLSDIDDILDAAESKNYKSVLLEHAQANADGQPHYKVISEEGPDHHKTFTIEVSLNGIVLGKGIGRSKKRAEQRAASAALEKLKVSVDNL